MNGPLEVDLSLPWWLFLFAAAWLFIGGCSVVVVWQFFAWCWRELFGLASQPTAIQDGPDTGRKAL